MRLWSPPKQRQRWDPNDTEILPSGNWGQIFFDLFYVGGCINLGSILKEASKTGTFKLKKVDLRNDGFDPSKVTDKLYFLDAKQAQYVELSSSAYNDIQSGRIRL